MIPGGRVAFKYEHEWPSGKTVELDVEAEISAYYNGVMYLSNGDPGYPPEGGEVEEMVVRLPDGRELKRWPDALDEALVERAQEEHSNNG